MYPGKLMYSVTSNGVFVVVISLAMGDPTQICTRMNLYFNNYLLSKYP